MRHKRVGFTLLELLVVVALVGLLASGAAMAFAKIFKSGYLQQGTDVLVGALREAQVQAFQDGNLWRVSVSPDASSVYLEQATDQVQADRTCGANDWVVMRRYPLPQAVSVGLRSGDCVTFGQAGRVVSKAPNVVLPVGAQDPSTGIDTLSRLVDGNQLAASLGKLFDPRSSSAGTTGWKTAVMPNLLVDVRELRYLSTLCLGLVSSPSKSTIYPVHINVVASILPNPTAESDWNIPLFDEAGPVDPAPSAGAERQCVNISVNRSIRYLRIRLSGTSNPSKYWVLDEIDLGARFFTIQYGSDKKIVEVNPTTGRVTSKNG